MGVKVAAGMLILSVIVITVIVNITTPSAIGPLGILVFFISAYSFFMGLFYILLFFLRQIIIRLKISPARKVAIESIGGAKLYYYATVLALFPVIYIGIQSMGSVGVFEVTLLTLFEVIACFFVFKRY